MAHVLWMGFFVLPGLQQAVDYGTQELQKICKVRLWCGFCDLVEGSGAFQRCTHVIVLY